MVHVAAGAHGSEAALHPHAEVGALHRTQRRRGTVAGTAPRLLRRALPLRYFMTRTRSI
jgi:hypothetical protein